MPSRLGTAVAELPYALSYESGASRPPDSGRQHSGSPTLRSATGSRRSSPERLELTVGYGRGERYRPVMSDALAVVRFVRSSNTNPRSQTA